MMAVLLAISQLLISLANYLFGTSTAFIKDQVIIIIYNFKLPLMLLTLGACRGVTVVCLSATLFQVYMEIRKLFVTLSNHATHVF